MRLTPGIVGKKTSFRRDCDEEIDLRMLKEEVGKKTSFRRDCDESIEIGF